MRIGVDVGGTKIEVVALGPEGPVLARLRVPTPRGDYPATLEAIASSVQEIERAVGQAGTVGVGIPGTESRRTGLIKNANSTWLIGRPLRADLAARLGRPVRLANDANCFALSEATDGAAAGGRVVFGVILGTGTGGGVVLDGHVWDGPNGIAGEWGHNPLPAPHDDEYPGPICYCGRRGCIETFLSGPGLVADYVRHAPQPGSGWPAGHLGRAQSGRPAAAGATPSAVTAEAVVARAAEGDALAGEALQRYLDRLARALASVINVLDPDIIVLGGGLSNVRALYEHVPRLWAAHVFSDEVRTRLVRAHFGDSSGVRGAAWLWRD